MIQRIRMLLAVEAATFILASLVHFGVFIDGYEHSGARIPEAVIAAILILGLLVSLVRPTATRIAALWSQGAALLGTFIGIFTIIIGVGPRTVPDVVYHLAIIVVLILGLTYAYKWSGATDESVDGR